MNIPSRRRLLSFLAMLAILVTTLLSVSPVFAKDNGTTPYTVMPGDTLKKIAEKYGLTVEKITAINPQIKDPNLIYPGQVITLPAGRSEGIRSTKYDRIFVWVRERGDGRVERSERLYLVKSGDSIKYIAKSFGITQESLLEANPQIDDSNMLFRGELLHIPYGLSESAPSFYQTPADETSR